MRRNRWTQVLGLAAAGLAVVLLGSASSCDGEPSGSNGDRIAAEREQVQLKNDVEGRNYNGRLALADNPATLIWCTAYPTSPNAKAFTVPIVGKLTSGTKRPYATQREVVDNDTGWTEYNPEKAGPDGMFGTSSEYKYGFDPAGNYHEFGAALELYCTNVPTVIQKETTLVAIRGGGAGDLASLDRRTQDALIECQRTQRDHTKACPAAAAILGVQ